MNLVGYRGILSALVALVAQILKASGVETGLTDDDQEKVVDGILNIATFGGIIASILFSYLKNRRVTELKEKVVVLGGDPKLKADDPPSETSKAVLVNDAAKVLADAKKG